MNICILTVPHESQRYGGTCGDWQFDAAGDLCITVSHMGDWRKEALVAVHELVEALLCKERGISEEAVTEFDKAYEEQRQDGDNSEPGDQPRAPYHREHQFATMIEHLLADELGVEWQAYEEALNSL